MKDDVKAQGTRVSPWLRTLLRFVLLIGLGWIAGSFFRDSGSVQRAHCFQLV